MQRFLLLCPLLLSLSVACDSPATEAADGRDDAFPAGKADGGVDEGSPEALGVLRVANTIDFETLDAPVSQGGVGLIVTAAVNIVERRAGADGIEGTADDMPFDSLADLDAVYWVGPSALRRLLEFADRSGFIEPIEPPAPWYSRKLSFDSGLGTAPASSYRRETCLVLPAQDDPFVYPVRIPEPGQYDFFVNAYQDATGDEPARMLLTLDGEPLAEFDVTAADGDWDVHHTLSTIADADGEPKLLEISFLNDFEDQETNRNLVLCGLGVDNLGTITYPGVPHGPVRGYASVDVDTSVYDTRRDWRVGRGDVPTTCVAKGQNPGRILWDCSFDVSVLSSRFAPYTVPEEIQYSRAFADPPYASNGVSTSHATILLTTSADPGTSFRPLLRSPRKLGAPFRRDHAGPKPEALKRGGQPCSLSQEI